MVTLRIAWFILVMAGGFFSVILTACSSVDVGRNDVTESLGGPWRANAADIQLHSADKKAYGDDGVEVVRTEGYVSGATCDLTLTDQRQITVTGQVKSNGNSALSPVAILAVSVLSEKDDMETGGVLLTQSDKKSTSSDWKKISVSLSVPKGARRIQIFIGHEQENKVGDSLVFSELTLLSKF